MKIDNSPTRTSYALIIGLLSLSASSLQQNCIVDKCRVCPDVANITCTSCDTGYYLKTFDSGDKTYNACWSSSKLIWGMITTILGSLLMCYLCKLCFDIGKKESLDLQKGGGNKLKSSQKQKYTEGSTLLSTQRARPRTQLIQSRPNQPLRPVPLPKNPRVQYISPTPPTRSRQPSPRRVTLNGQPYSFSQQPRVQSPRPQVIRVPPNRIPATNQNPRTQPSRVVPRISSYTPQQQNLGNVRTANPSVRQPAYRPAQNQPIQRPRVVNKPQGQVVDDDLGVNLTPKQVDSEPIRFEQPTRGGGPQQPATTVKPLRVTQRAQPSSSNLQRYGDIQEGSAQNGPQRLDNSTKATPTPVRGKTLTQGPSRHNPRVYRERQSPKDVNPYQRSAVTSPDLLPRRSRSRTQNRSISPRPSYSIQKQEAHLDQQFNREIQQEMIEEPSSPERPFQGGGIASSLGPRRSSLKMPRN